MSSGIETTSAHTEVPASHDAGHGGGNSSAISGSMFFWFLVVFGMAAFILKKYAFGPILEGLDQREAEIERSLENADRLEREMLTLDENVSSKLEEADSKARDLIDQGRAAAREAGQVIEDKAREEAQILRENAERDLESAKGKAENELRLHSAETAVAMATKLLQEKLDDKSRESSYGPADRRGVTPMSVVAKRYAEAYLGSSEENSSLDAVGQDIQDLLGLLDHSEELSDFVSNPLIRPEVQTTTLKKLFEGKVHADTLQFLLLLVQRERLTDLESILETSLTRWQEKKGILPVSIVSAEEMTSDQKKDLEKKLADRTGKIIKSTYQTDSSLIGGFQLAFQGLVEDYSLAAKLNTFKRNVLNA